MTPAGPRRDPRTADSRAGRPGLVPVRALLDAFHAADVRYCHWKSNEHLAAGLDGATDLDLLVDRRAASEVAATLARCGFKRFEAVPTAAYPAIEDHLAFDEATGRLAHVHLHHRLVLGATDLKEWDLGWEEALLDERRWDDAHGAFVADPGLEMLLLLARSASKLGLRDRWATPRGAPALRGGSLREHAWLRERTTSAEVEAWASRLAGPSLAAAAAPLVAAPPDVDGLLRLGRTLMRVAPLERRHGATDAWAWRAVRRATRLAAAANRRWLQLPWALRRRDPRGGLVVALLGADGSGKSTVAARVVETFAWKLDVLRVYHGSGDGEASWVRLPLIALRRVARLARRRRVGTATPPTSTSAGPSRLQVAWALALSLEKRLKLRRTWRARARGLLVIADRYPQDRFEGFGDGPLLGAWRERPEPWRRLLARWEREPYRMAGRRPPDLVIKLRIGPEAAYARKAEEGMSLDQLRRRVAAIEALAYLPERVVEIDAEAPLDEVVRRVASEVWARL